MATRTIDCVECGESVPYGRLSCPNCGSLLAAVRRTPPSADQRPASPAYLIEPLPATTGVPAPEPPSLPWPPLPAAVPEPDLDTDLDEEPASWAPPDRPEATLVARPYVRTQSGAPEAAGRSAPPGAYLPPSPAFALASSGGPDAAVPATMASRAVQGPADGRTSIGILDALPRFDAARLGDMAGSLVVVGSVMAILGFVLPWSLTVIGASGTGGYLDDWGLASPTHILALSAVLFVLGLGVVRTTVPAWLRTGVFGLALGGLLVGLTWPYVLGPLGADIGAMLTVLGGLALVAGGGLAIVADRHAGEGPLV